MSFDDSYIPEPNSGCWLWTGRYYLNGYGAIGKRGLAHRRSWEKKNGPIPDGLSVLHRCDVRCCVNDEHQFLGTNADNTADMIKKGRAAVGERNGQAKLTAESIAQIRSDTRLHREIAEAHCISRSLVGYIKSGKRWSHVR